LPKVVSSASSSVSRREVLAGLAALAATGCGYALSGRGSSLPDYIRTIGIPLFENRTSIVTLEQLFTEKVRIEFQSRGRYAVQPTEPGADAIVRGVITSIIPTPVAFGNQQLGTRYRLTVTVSVKVDDVTQQKTLWENPALTFSDEYELRSPLTAGDAQAQGATFLAQERSVMERMSTDFARSVVSSILEAF
jgi:hypothetical protein